MEKISLSDHFNYSRLLRFTLPSIIMMIFTSIYTVVDGVFISNFAGDTAFAAVNLIMPFLFIFSGIGLMLGTGGTALVSMKMGEGKAQEANQIFSLLVYVMIGIGVVATIISELVMGKAAILLGADEAMYDYCVVYGRIYILGLTAIMLQMFFQTFMVAAEKPRLGLGITLCAGGANIMLDALFVGLFHWGIVGAAVASVVGQLIGGIVPLIYFFAPNSSLLRMTKPYKSLSVLWKASENGLSEFMANISGNIINMVYNFQLMKYFGQNGVAAYGVIMYVCFIFLAIFFGFGMGTAPIIAYNYGAQRKDELHSLFKKCLVLVGIASVLMTIISEALARPLSMIFVAYNQDLLDLTVKAFMLFSLSYLLCGYNVFASSFFTALNNGIISAVISMSRLFVFQLLAVLLLPLIFGFNSIWSAVTVAEGGCLILVIIFLAKNQKRYGY